MVDTTHILLREASSSDLDIITAYTLELHQHEDDGLIAPHEALLLNLKKWLSSEIENPRSLFLIAEANNKAIGFIGSTSIINDSGFLENPIKGVIQLLWVEPAYRKKKVARLMLDEVEHCFKELGIQYVECSFTVINKLAGCFWSKVGYKANSITSRKFIN